MTPVDQAVLHDQELGKVGDCFRACVASLLDLPIADVPHFVAKGENWSVALVEWLAARGLEPLCFDTRIALFGREHEPCIASGDGPRGAKHSVVWCDGEVAHDPHPSRGGLAGEPEWFMYLVESEN